MSLISRRQEELLTVQIDEVKVRTALWKSLNRLVNSIEAAGVENILAKTLVPGELLTFDKEDSESEHGLAESDILEQMAKLKSVGDGYEDWSPEKLREKAIDILTDDIPF